MWVTGYRSYELNTFGNNDPKITVIKFALKNYLTDLLDNAELDWLITGPNLGVEQWVAECALELRSEYPLRLAIMTPYENFADRWNETNQAKFAQLTSNADFYASTSNTPYQGPMQLRNYQNFMLTHTDRALMIYDPEHPGKPKFDYQAIENYQKGHEYPLDIIDFYDLQDAADEYAELHRPDNYDY
ncbi:hypothetical protein LCB40_08980 [Lactobacillus corticis]|uniref:UPF0398 protein LCB40_08980 n=2 Tax=Lactobacillus corticis TaxID=2201249 RepID=A0A916QJW0_9LACO|nr:hypothetical protein LCB40_08980 [Lactobacillus corticis]